MHTRKLEIRQARPGAKCQKQKNILNIEIRRKNLYLLSGVLVVTLVSSAESRALNGKKRERQTHNKFCEFKQSIDTHIIYKKNWLGLGREGNGIPKMIS